MFGFEKRNRIWDFKESFHSLKKYRFFIHTSTLDYTLSKLVRFLFYFLRMLCHILGLCRFCVNNVQLCSFFYQIFMTSYYEPDITLEMRREQNIVPTFKVWRTQSEEDDSYRYKQWHYLQRKHSRMLVILPGEVRKGFWGEKMLDLSFEGQINIEQRVQGWKDILRQRQQQMQRAEM